MWPCPMTLWSPSTKNRKLSLNYSIQQVFFYFNFFFRQQVSFLHILPCNLHWRKRMKAKLTSKERESRSKASKILWRKEFCANLKRKSKKNKATSLRNQFYSIFWCVVFVFFLCKLALKGIGEKAGRKCFYVSRFVSHQVFWICDLASRVFFFISLRRCRRSQYKLQSPLTLGIEIEIELTSCLSSGEIFVFFGSQLFIIFACNEIRADGNRCRFHLNLKFLSNKKKIQFPSLNDLLSSFV